MLATKRIQSTPAFLGAVFTGLIFGVGCGGSTGGNNSGGNNPAGNNPTATEPGAVLDTTRPLVNSSVPPDGATGIATNRNITATFSEAMDPATINQATFTAANGGAIMGLVTYSELGRTATFAPNLDLLSNTVYTVVLTNAVTDLAGNAMLLNYSSSFTTGAAPDVTPPTVTLTNPADNASNVTLNKQVNATFSEPIDLQSINSQSFTLLGPGLTPVQGTLAYDSLSQIATFLPAASLIENTMYTATITTDVTDLAGNQLVSDLVFTFMTGIDADLLPVDLFSAGLFAVLAGSTVSSNGPTVLNGNLGVSPGTAIVGFPPGQVNGSIHAGDPAAAMAKSDLTVAYNDAQGRSTGAISLPGNLGGLTLTPGLYSNASTVMISGTGPLGILTLDAQGDANAVFIFKMATTLTTDSGTSIVLSGGAKASNIFWSVGTSATLGTNSVFYGNILADQAITLETGATLNGRALTRVAAVTLDAATVNAPAP